MEVAIGFELGQWICDTSGWKMGKETIYQVHVLEMCAAYLPDALYAEHDLPVTNLGTHNYDILDIWEEGTGVIVDVCRRWVFCYFKHEGEFVLLKRSLTTEEWNTHYKKYHTALRSM